MLTKRTKYGLKAMVYLANNQNNGPVKTHEIAEKEGLSLKFLETIMVSLRNSGIVGSKRGKNGGYHLIKSPEEILMVDLIRILEGPIALVPCVSLNFYQKCDDCIDEQACSINKLMKELRDSSLSVLRKNSLADVARQQLN